MTIAQMREHLRDISAQLNEARAEAQRVAVDDKATVEQIQAAGTKVQTLRARVETLQAEIKDAEHAGAQSAQEPDKGEARGLSDMLASREYARAFASALAGGVKMRPDKRCSDEHRILYDALTIAGGSGADGGFLVPTDMDTQIREQMRAMRPLRELVTVEQVSANSGWRVTDVAPTTGFAKLASEVPSAGVPKDVQPTFARVNYTLATYGLRIPVSNELLADETAGLIAYLARYFAKKLVLTENSLILTELNKLSPQTITPGAQDGATLKALKSVLAVTLDPAISAVAKILTNQSGYGYLDGLMDGSGRPLLQPDPTTGTPMIFGGRQVVVVPDAMLPNRSASGTLCPLYIGSGEQYMTLFTRAPLEVASTDVGGDAWASNATEVRGIARMGTAVFDAAAMAKREIKIADA